VLELAKKNLEANLSPAELAASDLQVSLSLSLSVFI
jgi:hypothetical protein